MQLFTRLTIFMFARRLVPRTHKMRIAVPPPAASTLRRSPTLAGFREIKKLFSAVCIENHRAYGDFQHRVFARSSVAVRPFTMSAALGLKFSVVAIAQQRVVVRICFDVNIAAMSAIATRRAATRDVLLPAKRDTSVAAATRFY